ncbi:helix-turn-helix domain-containing protein [Marimonas sp. MJW-29]|uniref:Helix-turn-helix domain-containing protein n=1 Tax=Sulfitobacter sediminis TaxID=3234186 RepID=A0ABV3RLN8_9RHOB
MTRPTSPTARHLYDAIEASSKTQKEIAKDAGFASPNILSMMKRGETKVPISRIPSLSQALDIDPGEFINIALHEYDPELHAVLMEHYGAGLTLAERTLLEVYDEAQHVAPFVLEAGLCDLLLELFVYSGRLQAEIG